MADNFGGWGKKPQLAWKKFWRIWQFLLR